MTTLQNINSLDEAIAIATENARNGQRWTDFTVGEHEGKDIVFTANMDYGDDDEVFFSFGEFSPQPTFLETYFDDTENWHNQDNGSWFAAYRQRFDKSILGALDELGVTYTRVGLDEQHPGQAYYTATYVDEGALAMACREAIRKDIQESGKALTVEQWKAEFAQAIAFHEAETDDEIKAALIDAMSENATDTDAEAWFFGVERPDSGNDGFMTPNIENLVAALEETGYNRFGVPGCEGNSPNPWKFF